MSDGNKAEGRFMLGFFLGGLLGALVIFFLGTKEGKKAGKLIGHRSKDILDDLEEKLEDLEKKGKEIVKQGEALKDDVVESIAENKSEITQEVTERLDSALAHIEEIQERGRDTTAGLRKKIFKNIPKKS
jgi:gas vesicle protein